MGTIIQISSIVIPIITFIAFFYFFGKARDSGMAHGAVEHVGRIVHTGADTLLGTRYVIFARAAIIIALIILIFIPTSIGTGVLKNIIMALSFLAGGAFCALAATIGVAAATVANRQTAAGAQQDLHTAFQRAFGGGAAIGMSAASLAVLAITIIHRFTGDPMNTVSFSFGAAIFCLFAKADEGAFAISATLMGSGTAKDEWQTVACVGSLSDIGSNLFCYSCTSLGAALVMSPSPDDAVMVIGTAAIGLVSCAIGALCARMGTRETLVRALWVTVAVFALLCGGLCWLFSLSWRLWAAVALGPLALTALAHGAAHRRRPDAVQRRPSRLSIVVQVRQVLRGVLMTVAIMAGASASALLSSPLGPGYARFGVGLAAVGMLSIAGLHNSYAAYRTIVESAKGLVEMADAQDGAQRVVDELDRSTATVRQIGADYSMCAAAFSSIALLGAFAAAAAGARRIVDVLTLSTGAIAYGVIAGTLMAFLFSAMFIFGVERTGRRMVAHIHRHLKALQDLPLEASSDYDRYIDIVTIGSFRELVPASLVAVTVVVSVGLIGGAAPAAAVMVGLIGTSVVLSAVLTNTADRYTDTVGPSIMIQLTAVSLLLTLMVHLLVGI